MSKGVATKFHPFILLARFLPYLGRKVGYNYDKICMSNKGGAAIHTHTTGADPGILKWGGGGGGAEFISSKKGTTYSRLFVLTRWYAMGFSANGEENVGNPD